MDAASSFPRCRRSGGYVTVDDVAATVKQTEAIGGGDRDAGRGDALRRLAVIKDPLGALICQDIRPPACPEVERQRTGTLDELSRSLRAGRLRLTDVEPAG
jgi:hypothetical protein